MLNRFLIRTLVLGKLANSLFFTKYTNDELLEAFGEMTLVELSEFVKAFEEKKRLKAMPSQPRSQHSTNRPQKPTRQADSHRQV